MAKRALSCQFMLQRFSMLGTTLNGVKTKRFPLCSYSQTQMSHLFRKIFPRLSSISAFTHSSVDGHCEIWHHPSHPSFSSLSHDCVVTLSLLPDFCEQNCLSLLFCSSRSQELKADISGHEKYQNLLLAC